MKRTMRTLFSLVLALCLWMSAPGLGHAGEGNAVSFAGQRVTLFIGFSPIGFGYDTYGRVLARYLGKYLPGQPTVVPENRPGAGSMSLANYLYNAAPKDGTEIALIGRGVAMDPVLNGEATTAKFDPTKFTWLGSMNNEVAGFFISDTAPAQTLDEILAGTPMQIGSAGAGSDPQIFAVALNSVLGTKLKLVSGYPGMNEILLAMRKGEVDGVIGYSWSVASLGSADLLKSGKLKLVMQAALQKHKALPNVPLVMDLVKNEDDRKVFDLIFSRQAMGRPMVAPPGLDPGVGDALRQAFASAMHDPELIAECDKLNMEINFMSGEDVQALVGKLYTYPPEVVARAQRIVAAR
jgi:tripartite-type tricarboxylate transporter receptor subunit TctC